MHYPRAYRVEGGEVKDFKEFDDEKALKLVALIYNVRCEKWEEGIARSIALRQYIDLLAKRKSAYLKHSGIFESKYDKVNLRAWKDADLVRLYRSLLPKVDAYYVDAAPELTEIQNAERILYFTALSAIDTEMKRRSNTRDAVTIAANILLGAIGAALSML